MATSIEPMPIPNTARPRMNMGTFGARTGKAKARQKKTEVAAVTGALP